MTPQDIKILIQTEIAQAAHSSQFNVAKVGYHTHDNINSPNITMQPNVLAGYYGIVNSDGTAGTIFPVGWTSTYLGTGEYQINHNLNTLNYIPMITPVWPGSGTFNEPSGLIGAPLLNSFSVITMAGTANLGFAFLVAIKKV
jgi:hypothetical protein